MESYPLELKLTLAAVFLAILTLFLGLAVTIAMDAKTKGEYRFAFGCFVFSALMLTCTVGVWDVTTEVHLLKRGAVFIILVAIVSFMLFEAIRLTFPPNLVHS